MEAVAAMEQREVWANGHTLCLGGRQYHIQGVAGMGANAIVYRVAYQDGLSQAQHTALLKELYPALSGVSRQGGVLTVAPDAQAAFDAHRQSYLRGNDAHLRQLAAQAGRVTGNIDSFAAFGTLYTLLDYHGGHTLEALLAQPPGASAETAVRRLLSLLEALRPFHDENLLHLDISADNILMLPVLGGYQAACEPMALIDYNGVWDRSAAGAPCLSSKAGYSAPEARLRDTASLGFATDLFSVCAVFFEMLTGRRLTQGECSGQFHTRMSQAAEAACEGLPQTARLWAVRILRKGLSPLAARRYQSIGQLRDAACELLDRIHGRGVTHAALWEAAAASLPESAPPEGLLPLTVKVDGHTMPAGGDWLPGTGHVLLSGAGGGGKTTLLAALHRRFASQYDPAAPVCYYIPLLRWQGRTPFLMRCLAEGITPADDAATQADVHAALAALLQRPLPSGAPVLVLLIDGLNETGARPEALYREIAAFARLGGVRMVATSRNAGDLRRLPDGFASAALNPPAQSDVAHALRKAGLLAVTPPAVMGMLTCPLLLAFYRDMWAAWRQSGQAPATQPPDFTTPQALLAAYIQGQVARFESQHRESEVDCLRARYATAHLLPNLADAMRGQPALTQAQAQAVVARDYRALRSRAFAAAYPAYLGKSRLLLQDVRSAAEWYDVAVREALTERLALLSPQRGGEVALRHDSFRPVLRRAARGLRLRLCMQRAKRAGAWVLAAALLAGALAVGRALLFPAITQAEQTYVQNLYNAQLTAIMETLEIVKAATGVRDALAGGQEAPRIAALVPGSPATLDLQGIPWRKAGLTREAWATLLAAPDEASRLHLGALLSLADATDASHTAAYRTQRLAQYDAFAAAYKTYYLLSLYAAYAQADDAARQGLYQILKASPAIRVTFIQTPQPQGDAATVRAQCDSAHALLAQTLFYQLADAQASRWPDTAAMQAALAKALGH